MVIRVGCVQRIAALHCVALAMTIEQKKSHIAAGLLILKRLKDYFFFSFFSILAFKPARMSLLSPRVEAGEFVLEATAS